MTAQIPPRLAPPPTSRKRKASAMEAEVSAFAARLKRKYAVRIARDARAFKKAALHYLRLNLPPGPGRLPDQSITRASTLRRIGRQWQDIYPVCIPGYSNLNRAERDLAASNLRSACRSRRNARKRRMRRRQSAPHPEDREK